MAKYRIPESVAYGWMREEWLQRPVLTAKLTGLPEPAGWKYLNIPKASLKLSEVLEAYKTRNPSTDETKRRAENTFEILMQHTQAVTLDDLTNEKLNAYRQHIEATVKGAGSRAFYYGKIKAFFSFGLKVGLDPAQIRAALDRCKVLWTGEAMPQVDPNPISRNDFHALLKAARGTLWEAWILCSLNMCLSIEEVCRLQWSEIDLARGTFTTIREKTKRERIPRAAVLWSETITALDSLPRKGPYVFTSKNGTRFNKRSRLNKFAKFRAAAKVDDTVVFGSLRDGAYTAAAHGCPDERMSRVLAGHRSEGLQDNYVLRNPEITRPACEAVYKAFFGGK